jgi:hypothetical protein
MMSGEKLEILRKEEYLRVCRYGKDAKRLTHKGRISDSARELWKEYHRQLAKLKMFSSCFSATTKALSPFLSPYQ